MAGKPRAVIDTNVFVSGLINPQGAPAAVLKALRSRRFTIISSPATNGEIIEVLNRPYIRERYDLEEAIFDVSFLLWELAEVIIDPPLARVSADPDDDKFLAAAAAGLADYLVTGDAGRLLQLRQYREVRIISPAEFLAALNR